MHAESGVSRCVLVTTVAVMTLGAYSAPVIVHAQSSAEFVPVTDTNSRAYLGGTFLERWDGSRAVSRGGRAGHRIGRAEKCAAGTRPARHTGGTPAQVSYPN